MNASTTSTGSTPVDAARFERACEWFLELREQSQSPEVVAEWLAWCRADPLNREAFERARSVWQVTGDVRAQDLALSSFVSSGEDTLKTPVARRLRWRLGAVGGAIAAGIAIVALYLSSSALLNFTDHSPTTATFETSPGENRTVRLPDGSTLALGGDSRLLTAFDEDMRQLTLERGEAYFRVAHNRARPFIVGAGNFRVTAVGTAFNVRTSSDRVVVAVAEGMVSIEPPEASSPSRRDRIQQTGHPHSLVLRDTLRAIAGQEVVLDSVEQQLQVVRVEPKTIASWQTGRLEFTREPLRSVLSSVNRYSERRVILNDPALGDLRFTGTVFADRVDDWIHGLPAVFPVTVRDGDRRSVVIESRAMGKSAGATVR